MMLVLIHFSWRVIRQLFARVSVPYWRESFINARTVSSKNGKLICSIRQNIVVKIATKSAIGGSDMLRRIIGAPVHDGAGRMGCNMRPSAARRGLAGTSRSDLHLRARYLEPRSAERQALNRAA
ncbi:MAG: hypothetical protein E5X72_29945 [Mesorhizobium sp.]|nr:MAG: hypothetical protein E5X72_29945 [Mesorhizobium sp.]